MSALSTTVVAKFCELCDWTFQSWQTRKYLFDDNPRQDLLKDPRHAHFFRRLALITQEYWLLQLAKLHDPPVQGGQINLTVDYIVSFGGWDAATRQQLEQLRGRLVALVLRIKGARNKILCHNDLATLIADKPLGEFDADADVQYFRTLHEFVAIIYDRAIGGLPPMDDLIRNDVECFFAAFSKGVTQL